ncbi:hypothetical protein [Paenibacillus hexagrammi]|uniref:Nuclear transport factor 2 family protein n=1 Tax=Paenibacillus hexagrammi TaxID=2908839 RepID=A0ABY3SEG4_9BACL|nr:hypothetical protein [Paenibacillus sp. YPD9-1]UJF32192.1 hypothetical protein L0M14_21040 [Paenibacillus sp. YPD9-1]
MKRIILLILTSILLITACSKAEVPKYNDPEEALRAYFTALYHEDWEILALLYGGDAEELAGYNSSIDKNNVPELLKSYCKINGGQIVQIDKILNRKDISSDEVEFTVTCIDQEGKPFKVRSTEWEHDEFRFTVKQIGDSYKVMTLPPYQA